MAFIEVYFYFLLALTTLLAGCSYWIPALVYVNALLLFAMLYLQIVSIPLQLNWSRNMYGGLLRRQFFFVVYSAVVYAVHFYFGGIVAADKRGASVTDALYFSFTTWTTLGYGDLTPAPQLRLATSLEALTGVLTIAVLTATVWLYCQERLRPMSADSEQYGALELQFDSAFGVWHELDSVDVRAAAARRAREATLRPCPKCGRGPRLDKFFEITGRLAPFAWFMVICECGAHSTPRRNGYLAEREWNRRGPIVPRNKARFLLDMLMTLVMLPLRGITFVRTTMLRMVRWVRKCL
jgi:hypothetical protein